MKPHWRVCGMAIRLRILVFLWCIACGRMAVSDESVPESIPATNLNFHRVFVPADRPDDWPTDGQRYLPIDRAEFTRLLGDAVVGKDTAPGILSAQITQTNYTARVLEQEYLSGRAVFQIRHHSSQPVLLPLEPWSMAISGARWVASAAEDDDANAGAPALVGNTETGKLAVLVTRSGRLVIDWTLRGYRNLSGTAVFALDLPQSADSEFLLETPADVIPELDRAVIEAVNPSDQASRWQIKTGGREMGLLRLTTQETRSQQRELTLFRQFDDYRISSQGIDLTTTLEVDVHGNPLSALQLRLDSALQLVAAQLDDAQLSWTISTDPLTNRTSARVLLPSSVTGTGKKLVLRAIAAVKIGEPQTLPRIRSEGMFWQEGTSTIHVQSPLVVNRVQATSAREQSHNDRERTKTAPPIQVQYFSYDGSVELLVDRLEDQLSLTSAQRLEFVAGEVLTQFVADVRILRGEFGTLTFGVEPDWQVDAVETDDPARLGEWDVQGTDPQRTVTIRLKKAVDAETPLRLKIFGRRNMALGDPLSLAALRMLVSDFYHTDRQTMWLLEPESLDLQLRGDERIKRIDANQLKLTDPLYVDPVPRGTAFVFDQEASAVEVSVSPRKPRFGANIKCTVEVQEGRLTETCQIRCQPSGAIMDRLLVHFSRGSKPDNWQWTGDASLGPLAVRRLSSDEQLAASVGSTGQAWEISWRTPQREAFEITGLRTCPFGDAVPVTIVSAPEAAEQSGTIFVRVVDDMAVQIVNHGLVALPVANEGFPALRGQFRFDPRRDAMGDTPPLLISPEAAELRSTDAWAWSCQLESRVSAGAAAAHMAVFRIQAAGQARVAVSLPEGATLRAVWVNDVAMRISQFDSSKGILPVALPAGQEFATVSINFVTAQCLPEFVAGCEPPFPRLDVPVLTRKWRLWVPGEYAVPTDSINAHRYSRQSAGLLRRLFGSLADNEGTESRNPFDGNFWSFGGISTRELGAARERIVAFLESLGSQTLVAEEKQTRPTWGAAVSIAAKAAGIDLLVARGMLAEAGIEAIQPLPDVADATLLERGAALVRQSNLVLVVCGGRYVLVSQTALALNRGRYSEIENLPSVYVSRGVWADDLSQAGKVAAPFELLTTDDWNSTSKVGSNPWILPASVSGSLADTRGWRLYEFQLAEGETVSPLIANTLTVNSLALALAMAVFATGLCLGNATFRWWIALCATAAAAALLLPLPWVPLASSALLGALASWLLRSCLASRRQNTRSSAGRAASTVRGLQATASAVLMAFCIVGTAGGTIADEPVPQSIPRVLFPINQVRLPVGDKVYVPDTFYRQLLETAARVRGVPNGWIVTQARYRTALTRESLQPEGAALSMRASFDIHSFQRDQIVRIPIRGEGLRLAAGSARIDGQLTDAVRATEEAVFVRVSDVGSHRVEITLLPTMQILGISNGFEFDVPPVAATALELTGPDATRVEVPDAQAPIQMDKERGRVVATLGSKRRLSLRWPAGTGGTGEAPAFELDELQWARVQPGALLVDLRLNIRVTTGRVRQLNLIADPRLRLISPTGGDSGIAAVRTTPGDPQLVGIDLAQPIEDRGTVELKFVVADVSGIGNLRMPRLEVGGVKPMRRWCAVSVDASLDFAEQKEEEIQPIAIPEFLAAWGPTDFVPHSAFRFPRGELLWSLASRTKNVSGTVNESISLLVEPTQTRVRWTANLDIRAGYAMQWRVQLPPELMVEEVAVKQPDGADNLERWSRDLADHSISIRLRTADAGQQQIIVNGLMARTVGNSYRVPGISLLDVMRSRYSLSVYRSDKVLLDVQASGNWQPLDAAPQRFLPEVDSGLVWARMSEEPAADATIEVRANNVQATANQVTIVNHDGDKWTADVDLQVQVQSGEVDSIVLIASREWRSPAVVPSSSSGNTTLTIEEIPGQKVRRIVVRPTAPIRDTIRLRLSGEVGATESGRLSVPEILPLDLDVVSRHVVLPTQLDLQSVRWDTAGLSAVDLPEALPADTPLPDSRLAFAVAGERFQATLRMTGAEPVSAQALLAENFVIWQTDGSYFGLATCAISPAGRTHIVIEIPAGLQPIHCRLGGVPVALSPIDDKRYQVPITVQRVPQTLEVVYRSEAVASAGEVRLQAPGLDGIDVRRTLWVVSGPTNPSEAMTIHDALTIAKPQYLAARQSAAERLRKISEELALDLSDSDSQDWFDAANRLDGRGVNRGNSEVAVASSRNVNGEAATFQIRPVLEHAIERLGPTAPPMLVSIKGKGTVLRLQNEFERSASLVTRSLLAVLLVVASVLCVLRSPRETAHSIPIHWPFVALGVVWLIAFSPAVVALGFFAAAALSAFRSYRQPLGFNG